MSAPLDFGTPLAREAYERIGAMAFQDFPPASQASINEACAGTRPPPRWVDASGGLAQLESRAFFEWYVRRGRRPGQPADGRRKLAPSVRKRVHQRDGGRCRYCAAPLAFEDMHVDHVVPVARGGRDNLSNLAAACAGCNLSKGAKTLEEWGS